METLALILGLLASVFIVSLSFAKGQRSISLISALLSAILVGQYLALEQPVATALSAMSLGFGILVFATVGREDRFSKIANSKPAKIALVVGYSAVFMALNGGLGWDIQLLAYLGSVLMVVVMMVENIWTSKLVLFLAAVCWTIFQLQTGAWGNLAGQVFCLAGLFWSTGKLWSARSAQRRTVASARPQLVAA